MFSVFALLFVISGITASSVHAESASVILGEEALLNVQAAVRGQSPENLHLQWGSENESIPEIAPLKDGSGARISVRQAEGKYPEGSVGLYLDEYDGETFLETAAKEADDSRPVFGKIYSAMGYFHVFYPYTGKPVTPKVIVEDLNGNIMAEGTDYELSYENNVKCGGAKVTVTPKGATDPNSKGEWFFAICPAKAKVANISVGERQMTVFAKDQRKSGADGYEMQYRKVGTQEWMSKPFPSSEPEVLLFGIDAGEYEIRIRACVEIMEPSKYNYLFGGLVFGEFSETVVSPKVKAGALNKVSVIANPNAVYTGKAVKPNIYLKDGDKILKKGKEYTITFKNNVHVGTADVIIKGKDGYYGTLKKHFYIRPKGTEIKALTAGKEAIKVQWNGQTGEMDGYQIRYAKTKSFAKTKTLTVKSVKKLSRIVRGLKSGQVYYFRVRTYRTVNGKAYFSKWSEIKGKKAK